ncbi:MAG: NAD-dependent epimerase/dehydratase family protein [Planctomycetes bacterium]|nr:NAD-dependent epimerase/dehydratase family protein [Planctomycetota bacterium]
MGGGGDNMNLVTGATGLLGSHLVEQLRLRNRPVRVLVRGGSDRGWLSTQQVEFAEGDLNDPASLAKAMAGVRTAYHAAARVGDWGPWEEFVRYTIDGTRNLAEAAIAAGCERFVHISSISAHGHPNREGLVLDETAPLGVNLHKWSYYSRAKVEAERMLWDMHKSGRIKLTVIRPSWLYGPRDRATIFRLARMLRQGKTRILGDGQNRLNVVHAGNVAEAAILAADSPQAVGESYNCCNDGEMRQQEWMNLLARELGAPPVTRHIPYRVAYNLAFGLECIGHALRRKKPPLITRYAVWLMGRRCYFSAEKARRDLGWKSTVSYQEGVKNTIAWLREQEESGKVGKSQKPWRGLRPQPKR